MDKETTALDPTEIDESSKMTVKTIPKDVSPSEEEHLSEYDKALADSFPASDPPTQP